MSEDLIERLRRRAWQLDHAGDGLGYYSRSDAMLEREAADALAAKGAALSEWKASHARVVEGFMEVCEAVGVQFDAPEAVAYAINAKINNAEHDKVAAESALSEMRVELERLRKALKPFATFSDHKTSYVELPVRWCIDAARALSSQADGAAK